METKDKILAVFNDPELKKGFTSVKDAAKKHQVNTRIFKVLRIKGAIEKRDDKNYFSPYFNFSESFATQIAKDSSDYKAFLDAKDTIKRRFENALLSTDTHPHDLDDWWQIVGYVRKYTAERAIEGLNLPENEVVLHINVQNYPENDPKTGRKPKRVRLSNRAFTHFCMAAPTFMGSVIRDYFYEVREELEELKKGFLDDTKKYRENFKDVIDVKIEFDQFRRGIKKKGTQLDQLLRSLHEGVLKLDGKLINKETNKSEMFELNADHNIRWNTFLQELHDGIQAFLERVKHFKGEVD